MRLLFKFVLMILIGGALYCHAADLAILRNGNSIRHERREIAGAVTRLYLSESSTGYIEIPTDQIERFETDTDSPAPVSNSQPALQNLHTTAATSVGVTTTPPPAQLNQVAVNREALNQVVSGAGERHQIDPDFINSVIRAESGFNNHAISKKGAQGLMQLMPQTASKLGVSNSFDPNANVEGGTKYLRELLEKYNYDVPKALAAYNAGTKRVDQYHGIPPYFETQTYVAKIIRDFNRQKIAEDPSLGSKAARKNKTAQHSSKAIKPKPQRSQLKTTALTSLPRADQPASR